MSGSPKYSTVRVAPAYARQEAERRRAQAAARRRREEQRARERAERAARRAAEAAARRERARAEAERRRAELAERRAAEQRAHAARLRQDQAGADARRLAEVRNLLGEAMASGGTASGELAALEQQLAALQGRVDRAEPLDGEIEELRGRIVLLRHRGEPTGPGADHHAVLAALEARLAGIGPEAAAQDPEGHRACVDLIGELRATAGPGGETRFEALLGTAEHALTRHAATAERQAAEERRRAERAREAQRQAEEARREAEERAAAQAAAEEAERERLAAAHAEALAEARDRLGVVRRSAEDAADEARTLGDPDLAHRIETAVHAVTGPLADGAAADALTAVTALEELLPEAELRLDELQLAHTRRMDLAQALQDAMLGEGFAFTGGQEQGVRLVLGFERPSGATYETTIATDGGGTPVLVYHVDGEPDVTLRPDPDAAVCDSTEQLLERVHEAIGERDGFVPGELTWDGKPHGRSRPPRGEGRSLPDAGEWRWSG
ncbi:hypothetical protein [Streptomyces sp. MN13]